MVELAILMTTQGECKMLIKQRTSKKFFNQTTHQTEADRTSRHTDHTCCESWRRQWKWKWWPRRPLGWNIHSRRWWWQWRRRRRRFLQPSSKGDSEESDISLPWTKSRRLKNQGRPSQAFQKRLRENDLSNIRLNQKPLKKKKAIPIASKLDDCLCKRMFFWQEHVVFVRSLKIYHDSEHPEIFFDCHETYVPLILTRINNWRGKYFKKRSPQHIHVNIRPPCLKEEGFMLPMRIDFNITMTRRQNDCAWFKLLAWFPREKEWAP